MAQMIRRENHFEAVLWLYTDMYICRSCNVCKYVCMDGIRIHLRIFVYSYIRLEPSVFECNIVCTVWGLVNAWIYIRYLV
jgi:hypothetical protein